MIRKRIKIGLVGLGFAGIKRYIPIMKKMNEFDLIGVIDADKEKTLCASKDHAIKYCSSLDNLDDIDWIDGLDAVVITTPPFSHYKYIKDFLLKGKHVLVDKPFVMTPEEADEVVELAKNKSLKLAVIHNYQFSDTFKRLLSDIEKKKIGAIKAISCSLLNNPKREVPAWHHQLPWGQFFDESPHSFYMIKRLVSERLKYVSSLCYANSKKELKTPSSVFINYLTWDDIGFQIPVELYFNFEAPVSEWHLKVVGEKGIGVVDYFRDVYIYLPNDGPHKLKNVLKTSFLATFQHWINQIKPAFKYLFGTWINGHDVVFRLFAESILYNNDLSFVDSFHAKKILEMQYEVINSK